MRLACAIAAMVCWAACCSSQPVGRWHIAFWNVENLFDTRRDSLHEDQAFTPDGENHWTQKRYAHKRNNIYRTVAAMGWPAVVGLAEVENSAVLRDLCLFTPLRRMGYGFVHFDSPDRRGVDCALIYRTDQFGLIEARPIGVSDSAVGFFTRDILMVEGVLGGADTCYLFINHWPSKLGGATADRHRMRIAHTLLRTMDSVHHHHPGALVLAMGDFNASPDEEAIRKGLAFGRDEQNGCGFLNLMVHTPKGTGTYKYKDAWSCIDQMIANRRLKVEIFAPDFLLTDDSRYLGQKPFRTYSGMKYLGGFSDHLPIIATLP